MHLFHDWKILKRYSGTVCQRGKGFLCNKYDNGDIIIETYKCSKCPKEKIILIDDLGIEKRISSEYFNSWAFKLKYDIEEMKIGG